MLFALPCSGTAANSKVCLCLSGSTGGWLPEGHSGYAKITQQTEHRPSAPMIGSIDEVQYLKLGCNDLLRTVLNHTI